MCRRSWQTIKLLLPILSQRSWYESVQAWHILSVEGGFRQTYQPRPSRTLLRRAVRSPVLQVIQSTLPWQPFDFLLIYTGKSLSSLDEPSVPPHFAVLFQREGTLRAMAVLNEINSYRGAIHCHNCLHKQGEVVMHVLVRRCRGFHRPFGCQEGTIARLESNGSSPASIRRGKPDSRPPRADSRLEVPEAVIHLAGGYAGLGIEKSHRHRSCPLRGICSNGAGGKESISCSRGLCKRGGSLWRHRRRCGRKLRLPSGHTIWENKAPGRRVVPRCRAARD